MRMFYVLTVTLFAMTAAAQADDSRYGRWGEDDKRMQEMVDELRVMVDKAIKARAADPEFLSDLRRLIRRYDHPWTVRIVDEDFSDGDFTRNPEWRVMRGYFDVTWIGLESRVAQHRAKRRRDEVKQTAEDHVAQIIGQILQEAMNRRRGAEPQPVDPPEMRRSGHRAKIVLDRKIPNAFALKAVISGKAKSGGIDLALYQGERRREGYRLSWLPDEGLALVRVSRSGAVIVERAEVNIADGRKHEISWTRRGKGRMAVTLDGKPLFTVKDRGFKDRFDGFALINRGGSFALHRLTIDGKP